MTETRVKNLDFVISSSACAHYLGFLSQRPKGLTVPDECLTCEKIFDCMAHKPEDVATKPEKKTMFSAITTEDLAEEFEEKNEKKAPVEAEVKHEETAKPTRQASKDDFTIESPGMLYAHWSGTVLIRKETLNKWGKVKEVNIETDKGKKITCKIYPVDDLAIGVLQVPDKMQLKLGVKKGSTVNVKPVIKS